jgi:hypothetical protein
MVNSPSPGWAATAISLPGMEASFVTYYNGLHSPILVC